MKKMEGAYEDKFQASCADILAQKLALGDQSVGMFEINDEDSMYTPSVKESNPKADAGAKKVPFSVIPGTVLIEISQALHEGKMKYGYHNWRRDGARWSTYHDAALRHLIAFQEGQDCDEDSGISHVTKAITGLIVLRDAMLHMKFTDDRPVTVKGIGDFIKLANMNVQAVSEQYKDCKPVHYTREEV